MFPETHSGTGAMRWRRHDSSLCRLLLARKFEGGRRVHLGKRTGTHRRGSLTSEDHGVGDVRSLLRMMRMTERVLDCQRWTMNVTLMLKVKMVNRLGEIFT